MEINNKGPLIGIRHIQVVCVSFATCITYMLRENMSIAILAMTTKYSSNPDIPTYNWDNKSVILSSFYWAYVVLQMIAAPLGKKFGTKNVLIIIMLIDATAAMLIPIMADTFGSYGVIGCRFVQGLAQGFVLPLVTNFIGKWVPSTERSRLSSLKYTGSQIGLIITPLISGFICSSRAGWPTTFYLCGTVSYIWTLIFFLLGADSPAEHKTISDKEKNFIQSSWVNNTNTKEPPIPWRKIFASMPTWAIVMGCLASNWGFALTIMELPTYMDKVMKVDLKSNGILASLPAISTFFCGIIFSALADYLINNSYASISFVRKICTTLAFTIPSGLWIIISYLSEDALTTMVTVLIISEGISSMQMVGALINHIDLSPNFCGVLVGVANTLGSLASIVAPLTVQFIVIDESNQSQWRIVFIISAVIRIGCVLYYVAFASGEVQPWNVNPKQARNDPVEETNETNVHL